MQPDDEFWMREALLEAKNCFPLPVTPFANSESEVDNRQSSFVNRKSVDVPVGALCVCNGEIIGRGHNRRELDHDPTAHAEVIALREACAAADSWRLPGVTLYVTLEPCPMCAGAIWLSRIDRLVFGAWDAKAGACGSVFDIARDPRLNHRPQVLGGVLAAECGRVLTEFFASRR